MDGHGHVIASDLNSPLFDFKFQLNKKKSIYIYIYRNARDINFGITLYHNLLYGEM